MTAGEVIADVIKASVPYVLPLLISGILALGALIGRFIHSKTGDNKILTALATGTDYVGAAVSHVLDGIRPDIQKALEDDGKLSPEELAGLKSKAIELIMKELPKPLADVAQAMGPAFQTWLSGKVGQAIQAQAPASPPSP